MVGENIKTIRIFAVPEAGKISLTVKGVDVFGLREGKSSPKSFVRERVKLWMKTNLNENVKEDWSIEKVSETIGSGDTIKDFNVIISEDE